MASNNKYKVVIDNHGRVQIRYRDSRGRFVKFDPQEQYQTTKSAYIYELSLLGRDAIEYAYESGHSDAPKPKEYDENGVLRPVRDGKWRHKTHNLHDSFGSAVFENGKVVEDTICFLGPEESKANDKLLGMSGRDVLLDYFHTASYGKAKNSIVLVCVAAMYYTKYLEEGTHKGKYVIRVISYATDFIQRHWHRYVSEKSKHIVLKGLKLPEWARGEE